MTDTPQGAWMREYERLWREYYSTPEGYRRAAARAALDAHVRTLVDALERVAANGCEHIWDGDCWVEGEHSGSFTLDSNEWATRICDQCAARAALASPKDAP